MSALKPIAFFFPQFHRVKENDEWWGEGFTEWNNVRRAAPQFVGHVQPIEPLWGYYNYDELPEFIEKQCATAAEYGIHGFCFYYYWFSGRRMLAKPLDLFRQNRRINFPFCICWANEHWVRRWEGQSGETLIEQRYPIEEGKQFIRDILGILQDKRYIEIAGRKLLLIFRTNVIPNVRELAQEWRRAARQAAGIELYLVCGDAYARHDPREIGFDAAFEFPPLDFSRLDRNSIPETNPDFSGTICSYPAGVKMIMNRRFTYPVFRGIMPSWDNTARMGRKAWIFHGSNPEIYQQWLRHVCEWTRQHRPSTEQLFFINAWNEWGEGCCLEPDTRNGYEHLRTTHKVLQEFLSVERRGQMGAVTVGNGASDRPTNTDEANV